MRHLPVPALLALFAAPLMGGCPLAVNYPDEIRYAGDFSAPAPQDESGLSVAPAALSAPADLKLVSFNVHYALEIPKALEALKQPPLAGADVIVLQEMDAKAAETLASGLGMSYVYYPASVQKYGGDFGNAVLSRWPIVDDWRIRLPHDDPYHQQSRIAVFAELDIAGRPLHVVSAHNATPILGLGARLDQAEAIAKELKDVGTPRLIGGDFNTSDPGSLSQTVGLYEDYGYEWATKGVGDTAGSILGGLPLDSLFANGLQTLERGVYREEAGSDHMPLWARFRWTP